MDDETRRLVERREIKRRRLHELDKQADTYGMDVPPHIEMERVQLRHELGMVETAITAPAGPRIGDELGASGRFLVYHEQNRDIASAVRQIGKELADFKAEWKDWRDVNRTILLIVGIVVILLLTGGVATITYIVARGGI